MAAREATDTNARDYGAYTVGWICALPKEQTAATAMLDQIHAELPNPPNDFNIYTLGSMGAHNIVIACLPKGKIGNNAASTVATRLVNTYPSVKFGLLVGIGGGIPPKVRLGDVVVSAPVYEYPGVVQWDFGAAEEGGAFRRIGALNNPPSALLTALAKLETKHDMQGSRIPEYLDDLRKNWPALVPKYIRSDVLKDPEDLPFTWMAYLLQTLLHIFWAILGYVHTLLPSHGKTSLVTADSTAAQGTTASVSRNFQVHYGLIASGNQVIKDARLRKTIDRNLDGNVLCVEMEAAGLMDNFPCIVIRGICDYADSRKNYHWQEHAAAVAAAFAKELLSVVPTQAVERMPAIEHIRRIDRKVENVSDVVGSLQARQHDGEHQDILHWLTSTDYSAKQRDNMEKRKLGTGRWLFCSETFQDWIKIPGQALFCPGMPGAGKTILTATVIHHLQLSYMNEDTVGVAYIYFDYNHREQQDLLDLASSLLKQLCPKGADFPDVVKSLYEQQKKTNSKPLLSEVRRALQHVVSLHSRVFILVDALDECYTATDTLSSFLDELGELKTKSAINVFATSRHIPRVTKQFETGNFGHSMWEEIRATEEDVGLFLEDDLERLPEFMKEYPDLMGTIKAEITASVDGMFLLAKLHVDFLMDKTSARKVLAALEDLPTGSGAYDEAYELAMKRIAMQPSGHRTLANQALTWIVHARGPISPWELQDALSVEAGQTYFDEEALPDLGILVSACAGLVTIDRESEEIRLVHYTAQQYFEKTCKTWFPEAEANLAKTCIAYLLLEDFKYGPSTDFNRRRRLYPFYGYAATQWGNHAREADELPEEVHQFLVPSLKLDATCQPLTYYLLLPWQGIHFNDDTQLPSDFESGKPTPLHFIAIFGLCEAVHISECSNSSIEVEDCFGQTPLSYAISFEREEMVELLLKGRAGINVVKPLHLAVEQENLFMVQILLDFMDNSQLKCPFVWDVLHEAAWSGSPAILASLLDRLRQSMASARRRETIFPLLESEVEDLHDEVTFDVPICQCQYNGGLLLRLAMEYEHISATRLLLDQGAEMYLENCTTFHFAAMKANRSIIELLLDRGADVEEKDSFGRTALSRAYKAENIATLLDEGADSESRDDAGSTPLHWASSRGTDDAVEILLERGAATCIESRDMCGRTPLRWAVDDDRLQAAEVLIRKGADVDTKDDLGLTPLHAAIDRRHDSAIEFLLDNDADVGAKDALGRTPLQRALVGGHHSAIQLLSKLDTCIRSRDVSETLPTLDEVSLKTVKLLVERGAHRVDERGDWDLDRGRGIDMKLVLEEVLPQRGISPTMDDDVTRRLHSWASELASQPLIARLLSGANVDLNSSVGLSRIILLWAAIGGYECLVEPLIDHGVNLEWKRGTGYLIATLRAFEDNETLTRLLLERSSTIKSWTTEQKYTQLYCAVRWGHAEEALSILSDVEVTGDYVDDWGATPMIWAARKGLGSVVGLLAARNEDAINRRDDFGNSPAWHAWQRRHFKVVDILQSKGARP
ncbi:hypothetical protein CP532_4429 [Ophiocordyceps camponoti-leonardi (nom. inval.)]|nr:hypothetical protein CP532_4429 [Ophiocordyceps camponoti-leonardi (nom. inval.)]